ncbi:MAG: diguanylate cyclase [Myxococcales bacterium]|nr:diguanylate cyclase [Myxococcales bacterium]
MAEVDGLAEALLALAELLCRSDPFATEGGEMCRLLAEACGAGGVALFSTDDGPTTLTLLGAFGLPPDYLRRFTPGEPCALDRVTGDLREAVVDGEPIRVDRIANDPWTVSLNSVARQGGFEATYSLPLRFDDRVVGALHTFFRAPVTTGQRRLLGRASSLVTATLGHRSSQSPGQRFPVPGLRRMRSRQDIEQYAHHIHAAAERYGQVYAVVVYAVDRPDILARRYGQAVAHRGVAGLLRLVDEECRAADLAGRLGDASCVVLMPGTPQDGAFRQCERVLERFGRMGVRTDDALLQLSASAGISCFPENGARSLMDAIRSAEQALIHGLGSEGRRIVAIAAAGSAVYA